VAIQLGEVVERIRPAQLAGGDQAHEDVPHVGTMRSLVEQRIPPMPDGLLQCPFADVIVQWRPRHAQEERQPFPALQQVRNRPAERRVGLHTPLVELPYKPDVEFLHCRPALRLVKEQAFLGR